MPGAIGYVAFFLAFLSTVGIIFTTAFYEWRRNSAQSSQAFLSQTYFAEGLWLRCSSNFPGIMTCDNYDVALVGIPPELQAMRAMMCLATVFGVFSIFCSAAILPCTTVSGKLKNHVGRAAGVLLLLAGDLQGQRAMMVIATILGFLGIISALLGLDCVSVMQGSKAKVWTGRSGGGCMILAGGLCIGAVSWYAANVIFDFFRLDVAAVREQAIRYEFGSALYVGWISAGLAILAGALLLCCSCGGEEDSDDSYRYAYKPPQSSKSNARSAEYV